MWAEVYEDTCQAMGVVPDPARCDAILELMEAGGCVYCRGPSADLGQDYQLQFAGAGGGAPTAVREQAARR